MCTLLKRILSTSLCAFSLLTLPAIAQQITTGGVIHFRGAIVESPCDVNRQQQQIELSCIRNGTNQNSLYNPQQPLRMCRKLPQSKCTTSMNRKTWRFLILNINDSLWRRYAHLRLKREI